MIKLEGNRLGAIQKGKERSSRNESNLVHHSDLSKGSISCLHTQSLAFRRSAIVPVNPSPLVFDARSRGNADSHEPPQPSFIRSPNPP